MTPRQATGAAGVGSRAMPWCGRTWRREASERHFSGDNAGIVVESIGTVQDKDATRTRVKWYTGLVNKHDKAIAALGGVKI